MFSRARRVRIPTEYGHSCKYEDQGDVFPSPRGDPLPFRRAGFGRANGSDVKLRGQGPRAEADAARRVPAFEARDAGGVTPSR